MEALSMPMQIDSDKSPRLIRVRDLHLVSLDEIDMRPRVVGYLSAALAEFARSLGH
jgi:hypothetical protein